MTAIAIATAQRLLLSIVQLDDAAALLKAITSRGLRATRIDSVGSFLLAGNATILSIVASERVPEVLTAIRETCQPRTRYLLPVDELSFLGGRSRDVESVQVGGATVFELPVLRFEGLAGPEPADRPALPAAATVDAPHLLVAAIVHTASAGSCLQALLQAGYRVTRINTVGGFLRRGYPTLLTGVTPDHVDHAIGLLRQACRQTSKPPVVCCRASPFSGLKRWFSRQSPTFSGPSAASISALSVAKRG